jgi:probable O-glycosylation ligase (exosortase A-associated)
MRDLILIPIVIAISLLALFRPHIGILGYVWYALLRPDILAWTYGRPYSMLIALATVVGALRFLPQAARLFRMPIVVGVIVLQIPIVLSHLTAEIPWERLYYENPILQYERMVALALLIPVLTVTLRETWLMVLVMGVSIGILGVKFGASGLVAGGAAFQGGYGGMLADNNDIALAFAMAVPLMWCMRRDIESPKWRAALAIGVGLTFAGIIMTHSRGGSLTLAVVLLVLVLRSKRKIGMIVFLAVAIVPAVYMVRDTYISRMETISKPTEEASSYTRIALAQAALKMWKEHPFLGMGFGGKASAKLSGEYQEVTEGSVFHDTYLQMLVDSGVFAALLWVALLWGTIIWLEINRRRTMRYIPEYANVPEAIQLSLLAFSIGSLFLTRVQYDFPYMLLMAAACWGKAYREEVARRRDMEPDTEEKPAVLEAA